MSAVKENTIAPIHDRTIRDFRLPARFWRELLYSGVSRSVEWYSFTVDSVQRICPIFKGQEVQQVFEDGTDTLSRKVGESLSFDAAWYLRTAQISRQNLFHRIFVL
jgi:hypothetical protein